MTRALLIAVLLLARPAGAHRLDEYLQATLFAIHPDRVEALLRLTPGVAVSQAVLATIDRDHDTVISAAEQRSYGERVLRELRVAVDGQVLPLQLAFVQFPAIADIRQGLGEIEIRFNANLPRGEGPRRLIFENRHEPRISAHLVNCLVPEEPGLRIVDQQRNATQSVYALDFTVVN